jgi:hypothetical protein
MMTEKKKRIFVIAIAIPVALLHFVTGKNYTGPFPKFVNSYLLDILIPFVFYFLLSLKVQNFKLKIITGVSLFGAASLVELLQYFDVPVLGRTFDPMDFLMYGIGILMAVIVEWNIISKKLRDRENI